MSKKDVQNLLKFSPIHNIRKGQVYPAVMVTTADHDDRVVPAHSFKYASTLQEKASHKKPLLIRIETKSGHGSSNLSKAIEETSDVYAFLFKSMDFKPKVKGS
jgi:prolyl oligopeptidase